MNKVKHNGFRRIDKREARKRYEQDEVVFILACNMVPRRFDQPGPMHAMPVQKWNQRYWDSKQGKEVPYTLDQYAEEYEYFNCNYETGYYPAFYIKDDSHESS